MDIFWCYYYQESHDESEQWKTVNLQKSGVCSLEDVTVTHKTPEWHPLKLAKINDIKQQLQFIPDMYRGFYRSLVSSSSAATNFH